jgi:hypothetical protein
MARVSARWLMVLVWAAPIWCSPNLKQHAARIIPIGLLRRSKQCVTYFTREIRFISRNISFTSRSRSFLSRGPWWSLSARSCRTAISSCLYRSSSAKKAFMSLTNAREAKLLILHGRNINLWCLLSLGGVEGIHGVPPCLSCRLPLFLVLLWGMA